MNIEVRFDGARLVEQLDAMIARGESMSEELPAEFSAWQEQDMGRRQADTQRVDSERVSTLLWNGPRPGRPKPVARDRRGAPPIKRPVLRPELSDMLNERMRELLKRTFAPWA
jgi:hypothetical protein